MKGFGMERWAVGVVAGLLMGGGARATEIAVTPDGSADAARCGAAALPCSLTAGKARARALAERQRDTIEVVLAGGTYRVTQPLVFTAADSGRGGFTIVYRARAGETPVLSAGLRLTGWQAAGTVAGHAVLRAPVPRGFVTHVLTVNDERAELGRSANFTRADDQGFLTTPQTAIAGYANLTDVESVESRNGFETRICHIRAATPTHADARPCFENRLLTNGQPYFGYFQNAFELTDAPGEWYLDQSGVVSAARGFAREPAIFYLPRPGETAATIVAVAGGDSGFIRLEGTAAAPVHHLAFRGLTLRDSSWNIVDRPENRYGYTGLQSGIYRVGAGEGPIEPAWSYDSWNDDPVRHDDYHFQYAEGAVRLNYANHIAIEGNRLRSLGAWGIVGVHGISDVSIRANDFDQLVGGAISLGGTEPIDHHPCGDSPRKGPCRSANVASGNLIADNIVRRIGMGLPESPAIAGYNLVRSTIENNELYDLPYSGIMLGVGFGYNDAAGEGGFGEPRADGTLHKYQTQTSFGANIVRRNRVDHYQGQYQDGGGIYTNDAQPGTVIEDNVLIVGARAATETRGLFVDEGSRRTLWRDNVVMGASFPILINCGPAVRPSLNDVHRTYATSTAVLGAVCSRSQNDIDAPLSIGPQTRAAVDAIVAAAHARR